MKTWIEQGVGIMIIGGIIGVGVFARMILLGYYIKLGRACRKIRTTRNKSLRYIKEGLEKYSSSGENIKNVMVYTECRLAECRLFGIHVGVWEGVMEQSLLLVLLGSGLCALAAVMCECTKAHILSCLFLGVIGGVAVVVLDMFSGVKAGYRRIRLQILDYMENRRWTDGTGETKTAAEELPKRKQKDVAVRKEKPEKVKKCHGKAQEEKRRLTEELLRDRRNLEAQRIAERWEREKETEQVNAEAAVTAMTVAAEEPSAAVADKTEPGAEVQEISYEELLQNVLAEYLG